MFFRSTLLTTASLLTLTSAHFRITYPPDRGSSGSNQDRAPCGGLSPSNTRTEWPINGGRLEFEAGHDEAHTEVRLYVGSEPPTKDEDFDVLLVPVFNQIGLGTFCWNQVAVPNGTSGVKDGAKATLVLRQGGHTSGWLYNCADIVFSSNPPELTSQCTNTTGIDAEPLPGSDGSDNDDSGDDSGDGSGDGNSAASSTTVVGGLLGAGVLAVAAMAGIF